MRLKAIVILAVAGALAGCGSSAKTPSTHSTASRTASTTKAPATAAERATSEFADDAGLAFGTFYRYLYNPYRAGAFSPSHRDAATLAKASAAVTYVAIELQQATSAARTDKALAKIARPLAVLGAGFRAAIVKLKTGHFKLAEIEAANIAISSIKGSASQAGMPITESAPNEI